MSLRKTFEWLKMFRTEFYSEILLGGARRYTATLQTGASSCVVFSDCAGDFVGKIPFTDEEDSGHFFIAWNSILGGRTLFVDRSDLNNMTEHPMWAFDPDVETSMVAIEVTTP